MTKKTPVLLSIHRMLWVLGVSFLLVCSTFGAISKLFFFSKNGLDIAPNIQVSLGFVQLVSVALLLQQHRRKWGIGICFVVFSGFTVWWGLANVSGLLFSFFGLCVCLFVWNQPKDVPTVTREGLLSVSLQIDGEITVTEEKQEADLETLQRDKELWMESANEEDIMNWLYEEE